MESEASLYQQPETVSVFNRADYFAPLKLTNISCWAIERKVLYFLKEKKALGQVLVILQWNTK